LAANNRSKVLAASSYFFSRINVWPIAKAALAA
jgi:hypothetical protein